ncbi:hypothetical protein LC085_09910 [Bacillus tianshenii]|uniref:hypothetical protein n=1 Tax=Sutcliffiella tianshenii TaxID=1463404 RepID=UPI001CD770BE|nr:hypothetical protein [Bacillus tianshenii]MCA1320220.1 hypothetical protein [Bacillus tianshenii]
MKKEFYNSKIFILILSIVIFLSSGYALTTVFNFYLFYLKLSVAFILLLPTLNILMKKGVKPKAGLVFILLIGIILTMIASGFDNVNAYIGYIILILLAFEIMLLYDFKSIKNYYVNIMTIIAIVSLIGYFAVNVLSISLPTVLNINNTQYGNGIIFFTLKGNEIRNCGPFWEPGVYASYLTFAILFILLGEKNKYGKLRLFLFYLTLITVNSSAGFMLMLLSLFIPFLKNKNVNNHFDFKNILNFFMFTIAILIIINLDNIILAFFNNNPFVLKLLSENVLNSSRYIALQANWSLFLESPYWGLGVNEYARLTSSYTNADMSTSLSFLSIFGLSGIIYTLMIIIGAFNMKNVNSYIKVIVSLMFLIIVNKEPHQNILFTWILILCFFYNNHLFSRKSYNL